MADEVLKTMIKQLQMQGVNLRNKDVMKINDLKLQISNKYRAGMKKKKGVSIAYNKGWDLYDVEKWEVDLDTKSNNFGNKTKSKKVDMLYADQLGQFF